MHLSRIRRENEPVPPPSASNSTAITANVTSHHFFSLRACGVPGRVCRRQSGTILGRAWRLQNFIPSWMSSSSERCPPAYAGVELSLTGSKSIVRSNPRAVAFGSAVGGVGTRATLGSRRGDWWNRLHKLICYLAHAAIVCQRLGIRLLHLQPGFEHRPFNREQCLQLRSRTSLDRSFATSVIRG